MVAQPHILLLIVVAACGIAAINGRLFDLCWKPIEYVVTFWDHLPIAFLVILACVLYFGAKSIEVPDDYRRRSKHAGVVAWLAYLIIHFCRDQVHTFDQLLPFVVHGFLGAVILASTLVWSRNFLGFSKRYLHSLVQRRPGRKRAMAELQRSYRQELDLIRSANLRRYERRVAREDAKRRYLRRLRQLLES